MSGRHRADTSTAAPGVKRQCCAAEQAAAPEPADRSRTSPPLPMQIGHCARRYASPAIGDLRVPRRLAGQCFRRRATLCCASAMATRGVASASTGTRALGHERDRRGRRSPMRELDENQERTQPSAASAAAYGVAYAPARSLLQGGHPRKGLIPRRRPAAPLSQRQCAWLLSACITARRGSGHIRCGEARAATYPTPVAGTCAPALR